MAIKVNGTTVIDDSRNLSNVGGLKTVNGTSLVGSGDISAGASTSINAVGTYGFFHLDYDVNPGGLWSGSNIAGWSNAEGRVSTSQSISGTWRCMGYSNPSYTGAAGYTLFVRVS